jgi:hypothetical protein
MNQRSICLFLAMKGLSARDVHNELVAVLGPDAIAYSTVTSDLRQRQIPAISSEPSNESPTAILDDAILDAHDKQPFCSVGELAKLTCIPTTIVYQHHKITRVCREASSLGSSHLDEHSKNPARHSLKSTIARDPLNQTSRLTLYSHL